MNPFATRDAKWHFASEASDDPSRREMILRFRSQRRPLATRNDTSLPKYLSATTTLATRNDSLPKYLSATNPSQREMMLRFRSIFSSDEPLRDSRREMILRFRSLSVKP